MRAVTHSDFPPTDQSELLGKPNLDIFLSQSMFY